MTDIKCPVCGERISGRSSAELTEMLSSHLANTHQITRTSERGRGSPSGQLEREVTTWSARDPSNLTPEETRKREEVARFNRPPLGSETPTERVMETWSGREPYGESPESARQIEEANQWKYPRQETREVRVVGTWRSENRPRTYQQEAAEWRYPHEELTPEERMRDERMSTTAVQMSDARHGGGTMHRMMNRRQMTTVMECPICGRQVFGSDDDDLTDELRFHFRDVHDIRRM